MIEAGRESSCTDVSRGDEPDSQASSRTSKNKKFSKILKLAPFKRDFTQKKVIYGFDIETHGSKNEFLCACVVNETEKHFFNTKEALQDFFYNKLDNALIIATNLAFDFFGAMMDCSASWRMSERKGRVYKFTLKRNIVFLDTLNFYPASVEQLGKSIGIPKLPHPSSFKEIPQTPEQWVEMKTYCENDAYISFKWYVDYVHKYLTEKGLPMKTSIASVSLSNFRKHYLDRTIPIERKEDHDIVFKAYFGGRTENFKRGRFDNVNYYDVNSLYPFVMTKKYPDPTRGKRIKQSSLNIIDSYEGVSYIEGYQEKRFIPVLPVRHPKGRVVFPCGLIKGYYTHVELRYAQQNGFSIHKFGDGLIYLKTCEPFTQFIDDHYKLRLQQKAEGDSMELMTKLIMNSLYGKFAFDYRMKNEIKHESQVSFVQIEMADDVQQFGEWFELSYDEQRPTNYSVPIWSAYVTSHARIHLHKALVEHKDTVIYCDTDSLIIEADEMKASSVLGDFKKENDEPLMDCLFIRPKFYYAQKARIKGVPRVNGRAMFDEIVRERSVKRDLFIKFRSAIKSRKGTKRGELTVNQVIEVEKKFDLEDMKRQWERPFSVYDSQTSEPLFIDESFYEQPPHNEFKELKPSIPLSRHKNVSCNDSDDAHRHDEQIEE